MRRRFVAILNPASGRRDMRPVVRHVAELLRRSGGMLECHTTAEAGHATALAAGVAPDTTAVLVVGGDGTVCEVINGLTDRPVPIVILRTGTENLLARELRMPVEPRAIAQTLLHGAVHRCDVGVVNDKRFMAVVGVGFDAECVRRLADSRDGHITHWDYFWPIWRSFWSHRFPRLYVEADGDAVFEGTGLALIGMIGRYSAGLRMLPYAAYDDGLLDLCVLPCASRRGLMVHAARAFLRRHVRPGDVVYRQCKRIYITSTDCALVEIDGDVGGEVPVECSVLPGATSFLRLGAA